MATLEATTFRPNEQDNVRVPKLQRLVEHLIAAELVTLDDVIEALAALTPAADQIVYWTSPTVAAMTGLTAFVRTVLDDPDAGTVRTTIGLGNVDNTSDANKPVSTATQAALDAKQPLDAELTALAGLTSAADRVPYFTGSGTAALTDFTAAGRTVVAAAGTTGTGNVVFSASPTLTGTVTVSIINASGLLTINSNQGWRVRANASSTDGFSFNQSNVLEWSFTGLSGGMTLKVNGSNFYCTAQIRMGSMRIDQAATAGAVAATHTVPIDINGVAGRMLVAIP